MLAMQIFKLRNFFCHPNKGTIEPLVVNMDFYHFFAGWLLGEARMNSLENGVKSDRIFKMSVMNLQRKDNDDRTRNTYAFTRRGIILLTCLALYKDDAIEFCQVMHDMKLPRVELEEDDELTEEEKAACRKKASIRKAYHLVMTYFSQKRRRHAVNQENLDFVHFTDIIGYLNKVPGVSLDYLALNDERSMLASLAAASTESEENKRFKYTLHHRMKDRFLTFLAGFCEDFDLLPSIRFKRLDISDHIGRKRYCFGKENDNSNGQEKHYAIEKDAIRFEFRPTQHYGQIHIDSLRSAVSASELKRMVLASVSTQTSGKFKADKELEAYFSAYHKVLEMMLNEPECDFIDRKGYLPELTAITGATAEELADDKMFLEKMRPFFPENLSRFFIPQDNIPGPDVLAERLRNALTSEIDHDRKFIERLDGAEEWFQKYKDVEKENCPKKPQEFRFNDGDYISKVFALLNLYLPDDRKFRQLPRGKQHRDCTDFEYQTLHAVIGRFATDPQELWDYLLGVRTIYRYEGRKKIPDHTENVIDSKRRPQLFNVADKLRNLVRDAFAAEKRQLQANPRLDGKGRPVQPRYSLQMLARAAVKLHEDFCKKLQEKYRKGADMTALDKDLREDCRRFGVRLGMPLCHDAILRTILHIDEAKWQNAYNYDQRKKWENRSLQDGGHVVTQVPLPNFFTSRSLANNPGIAKNQGLKDCFLKDGAFDFNRLFREFFAAKAPCS